MNDVSDSVINLVRVFVSVVVDSFCFPGTDNFLYISVGTSVYVNMDVIPDLTSV